MGNDANCQRFCDHKEDQKQEITSELRIHQYPLECELCQKEVEHTNFKMHLDFYHFASVQQQNQNISVFCILCDKSSDNLADHRSHLIDRHPYTQQYRKGSEKSIMSPLKGGKKQQIVSNKLLKSKLKQIDSVSKIRVVGQIEPNKWIVEYQSKQYEMYRFSKQYNGMQYDQNQIYPELVLFPVFTRFKAQAKFYTIERNPLQRTIQCTSYIICDPQS